MKSQAIFDVSLSIGARLLYAVLDDLGGQHGTVSKKQASLAAMMAVSDREIRRDLSELEGKAYVRLNRERHVLVVNLGWVNPDRTVASSLEASDRTVASSQTGPGSPVSSLYSSQGSFLTFERLTSCECGEPHDGPEPRRCACGRVHRPEEHAPEDALAAVVAMLHGYVRQCGLAWPKPDERIAGAVLAAAGGAAAVRRQLRALLLDRKARPSRSYAWFVAIFEQQAATA